MIRLSSVALVRKFASVQAENSGELPNRDTSLRQTREKTEDQGAGIPAAFTASAKVLRSLWNTAATCSLVWPPGKMPRPIRRADISGAFTISAIARAQLLEDVVGVPLGTRKPFHDAKTKPGRVSEAVGISGALGSRCAVPTASSRIAGWSFCDSSTEVLPK